MNVDISGIIAAKLAQMEEEGTIKRKIEETLEKSVLDAITSELSSYSFRSKIAEQVKQAADGVAERCGLSAYNGFIVEKARAIVQELYTNDIAEKMQAALDSVLLKKYENIKLSDIFNRYREWVLENTDESDKYEREHYTATLDVEERGAFIHYKIRFADRPLTGGLFGDSRADIEVHLCSYGDKKAETITGLYVNNHDLHDTLKIGYLTDFEAFLVNLYYNGTMIQLDVEDVDDDDAFDIDI